MIVGDKNMKTIYIDEEFQCHISPADGMFAIETDFFDGRCDTFIEGYRYIPAGKTWMREDGTTFDGEMIAPFKNWKELDDAQREYEWEQLEALKAENEALVSDMAQMVEDIYQADIEILGI